MRVRARKQRSTIERVEASGWPGSVCDQRGRGNSQSNQRRRAAWLRVHPLSLANHRANSMSCSVRNNVHKEHNSGERQRVSVRYDHRVGTAVFADLGHAKGNPYGGTRARHNRRAVDSHLSRLPKVVRQSETQGSAEEVAQNGPAICRLARRISTGQSCICEKRRLNFALHADFASSDAI